MSIHSVFQGGEYRKLGLTEYSLTTSMPAYATAGGPMFTLEEINEAITDAFWVKAAEVFGDMWIKDQNGRGACAGCAAASALERARARRGLKYVELSGDAITICKIIAEGETTYKKPAWTYSVREESSSGFTTSDLDDVGKIVKNPPGNPRKPSGNWTWLKAGPNQEQSGDSRFFKDYNYILIEDNEKNNFLYD
jgi:hypothetical protein